MTTTTENFTPIETLKVRVERDHKSVSRLLLKLRSYRFEPKDYECFQLFQRIKTDLISLSEDQVKSIDDLKKQQVISESFKGEIEGLLQRFKQVEQRLAEYLVKLA